MLHAIPFNLKAYNHI